MSLGPLFSAGYAQANADWEQRIAPLVAALQRLRGDAGDHRRWHGDHTKPWHHGCCVADEALKEYEEMLPVSTASSERTIHTDTNA